MTERKGKYLEVETEIKRCKICGKRPEFCVDLIGKLGVGLKCYHDDNTIIVVANESINALNAWNKLND